MKIIKDNIWNYHNKGYIVIPTNGYLKKSGENVMGAGLAKQVKEKYPEFPKLFGNEIKKYGNVPLIFTEYKLITFPVKHVWWEKADLKLIQESARLLNEEWIHIPDHIFMPKVGCGNGQLNWKDVEPIIETYLSLVTIVDYI